jgi:trans-2,3-dihydro-3-hydroxyanthranilate isomerase
MPDRVRKAVRPDPNAPPHNRLLIAPILMVPADKILIAYWVDAFANQPFQGNPAVVIPQADGLSDLQMQQIAREVNCSETAFVLQPTVPEADFRLRWFTPTQEVDLCGHATIATLHALAQEGRFNLQRGTSQILYLETRSGILKVTVDYTQDSRPWVWLTLPNCTFEAITPNLTQQLTTILGYPEEMGIVEAVVDSHNRDVLLPIAHLDRLQGLKPDMARLSELGQQKGWRGICVYTQETAEPNSDAHSRFFAPQSGIYEDPVTGSVSGPLAVVLSQKSTAKASPTWRFEQGDCLGRAGRLLIELHGNTPKLGGQAITVMRGELYL